MNFQHLFMRLIGYLWALPVTLVGLLLVLVTVMSGGAARVRSGVVEAWGGWMARFLRGGRFRRGGAAMTLGHVILARDFACLQQSLPHELQHVRQFEIWGPLLLPLYWIIAIWLWWRGFHLYLDHPLEPDC